MSTRGNLPAAGERTDLTFEVSGKRSHEAIEGSRPMLVEGGPHGLDAGRAHEFDRVLLEFWPTEARRAGMPAR